jgi:multidrug efflux system membrane fusion protein
VEGSVVVEKGLEAGERVVTDGQIRLVPGTKVELKPPVGAPTPAATPTATASASRS